MSDQTQARETLTLASELPSVDTVEQTTLLYAQRAGFDEDMASNMAMVTREAAVNAIVHGNKYDSAKQVTATFELSEKPSKSRSPTRAPGLTLPPSLTRWRRKTSSAPPAAASFLCAPSWMRYTFAS